MKKKIKSLKNSINPLLQIIKELIDSLKSYRENSNILKNQISRDTIKSSL